MHPEFGNARILAVRPETAASDVLPTGELKDRPVLNAVASLCLDLVLETGVDLSFSETTNRYKPGYVRIAPERACEGKVGLVP
jgi:hypothetical protein